MENSRKIKREMLTLLERKVELSKTRDAALAALTDARTALINGKGDVFPIEESQSSFNAVNSVLAVIETQVSALKNELEKVLKAEAFEMALAEICELDANMESVVKKIEKKDVEFDNYISQYVSETLPLRSEASKTQYEFRIAVQKQIPAVNKLRSQHLPELELELDSLFEKLRGKGAKLEALRADRVFNEFISVLSDEGAYSPPQLENGDVVNLTLKVAQTRKNS